jgi:hypothetical protein
MRTTRRDLVQGAALSAGLGVLGTLPEGASAQQSANAPEPRTIEPLTIKRRGTGFRGLDPARAFPGYTLFTQIEYDGKSESIKVDDDWLNKERKRIEDEYTFQINNFGRVILYSDRDAFDKATSRFKSIVEKYQGVLHDTLVTKQSEFERRIVEEFYGGDA